MIICDGRGAVFSPPAPPFFAHKHVRDVMKDAGATRINVAAIRLMHDYLVEYSQKITAEAIMLQKYGKRRTLAAKDIKMARERCF